MLGRIAGIGADLVDFWERHGEWSNKTFGDERVRGPAGPTKHLKKEADEVLAAVEELHQHLGDSGRIPSLVLAEDVHAELTKTAGATAVELKHAARTVELVKKLRKELVDEFFLVLDAARRSRFKVGDLLRDAIDKLKENEARTWPPVNAVDYWHAEAVEHDRSRD